MSSLSSDIYSFFDSEYWVLKYCEKIDFLAENYMKLLEQEIGKLKNSKKLFSPNSFIDYKDYFPEYPKKNDVIFLSRLVDYKNPILFLNAVKIFNSKFKNGEIQFYIIGSGPLEKDIKNFIHYNKLYNVKFVGKIFHSYEYLRRSKVFISIQQCENYPSQSLLEAMACENAIIASHVGETKKIVTENEGILVNLEAEEISNALIVLFSTNDMIKKLGRNARVRVLKEQNLDTYYKHFRNITN